MMVQIQEMPGVPDPARRAGEFAIDRECLFRTLLEGHARFFRRNPAFRDMWAPTEQALHRLAARRAVRAGPDGAYAHDPACPRCARMSVAAFARSAATRFQAKFLAAWTDPVRRPPMITDLAAFFLARNPEIQERGLDLVVNVHKLDHTRIRCVVWRKEPTPC
jgi:hypothetical protein